MKKSKVFWVSRDKPYPYHVEIWTDKPKPDADGSYFNGYHAGTFNEDFLGLKKGECRKFRWSKLKQGGDEG